MGDLTSVFLFCSNGSMLDGVFAVYLVCLPQAWPWIVVGSLDEYKCIPYLSKVATSGRRPLRENERDMF